MSDTLTLLSGEPFVINSSITINNPTLREIKDFGEERYWGVLSRLTASPYDLKVMLDDGGIRYEDISDYELFLMLYQSFTIEDTRIFFGDLDIASMNLAHSSIIDDIVLISDDESIVIDKGVHSIIIDHLRSMHYMKRNWKIAGNEFTRRFYMDEDRRNLEMNKNKPFVSNLAPLISTVVNCAECKYTYNTIYDLAIYPFMDCVKRVQVVKNCDHLMYGVYTGNVDVKKMNKDELNIFRALDS